MPTQRRRWQNWTVGLQFGVNSKRKGVHVKRQMSLSASGVVRSTLSVNSILSCKQIWQSHLGRWGSGRRTVTQLLLQRVTNHRSPSIASLGGRSRATRDHSAITTRMTISNRRRSPRKRGRVSSMESRMRRRRSPTTYEWICRVTRAYVATEQSIQSGCVLKQWCPSMRFSKCYTDPCRCRLIFRRFQEHVCNGTRQERTMMRHHGRHTHPVAIPCDSSRLEAPW